MAFSETSDKREKNSVQFIGGENVWTRSCEKEIIKPIKGIVRGKIPSWINGNLLRNGPGSIKVGETSFNHLFDAAALLHRFNISDGKVTYQCRFLKSEAYKRNLVANKIVVDEFGTCAVPDPCESIFKRLSSIFNSSSFSDNALISIHPFNGEFYALTEFPIIYKFDQETLETSGKVDFCHRFLSHSAHPVTMPDGSVFNLGTSLSNLKPYYNIIHFPKGENLVDGSRIVAKILSRWTRKFSYMHTFGVTENFFLIIEQPWTISMAAVVKSKLFKKPFASCFNWEANQQTVLHLIDRKTGKVSHKFKTEAFCFFHIINQFETKDSLIVDICCFPNAEVINDMYIESLQQLTIESDLNIFLAKPFRFVLPLNQQMNCEVRSEPLCDVGCELPRINDKFSGREYQFFYALSSKSGSCLSLIKFDVKNKSTLKWSENNCFVSEPIFVPSPNLSAEDDGVILASMIWGQDKRNQVGLLVLDAKTMNELGRCEFNDLPSPVPKCFHGWFAERKV